jgi:hypothetical protein
VNASSVSGGGNLYIRVKSDECSRTKLVIKLDDVGPLPKNILLSIKNEKTGAQEIERTSLELQNGEYIWTGLIQLGNFTANVIIPNSKVSLPPSKFTNIKLLMQFQNNPSTLVQIRNGDGAADKGVRPQEISRDIPIRGSSPNVYKIHLLLIGSDNRLAAQYLGTPMPSWTVTVPSGTYKLIVIEYYRDESKCSVNSQQS